MKTKGIFRLLASPILALMSFVKSVPYSTSSVGGGTYGGGRQAFLGISGPRTRAMKRRHPL